MEKTAVCYGTRIRLRHRATNILLKSVAKAYTHPNSSGQQIVGADNLPNEGSLWLVKGSDRLGDNYPKGQPVKNGDIIRLEHVETKRNLHSHHAPSPLTNQQEVTAYGSNGVGDGNDEWTVYLDSSEVWQKGEWMRLGFRDTAHRLHSHSGYSHPQYTAGLQEVTANPEANPRYDHNDFWKCDEEAEGASPISLVSQTPRRSNWIEVIGLVGSIASITGWTLFTIQDRLNQDILVVVVASILAMGFMVGAMLFLAHGILTAYRRFTFNPQQFFPQRGFVVLAATVCALLMLAAWKVGVWLALHPLQVIVRWLFESG